MAKFEFNDLIFMWIFSQNGFSFNWDSGNSTKNLEKHEITCDESESVFNSNLNDIIALGLQTSPTYETDDKRFGIFGKTNTNKFVFLCFTLKENDIIRVISVREMNKKEKIYYDKLRQKSE